MFMSKCRKIISINCQNNIDIDFFNTYISTVHNSITKTARTTRQYSNVVTKKNTTKTTIRNTESSLNAKTNKKPPEITIMQGGMNIKYRSKGFWKRIRRSATNNSIKTLNGTRRDAFLLPRLRQVKLYCR